MRSSPAKAAAASFIRARSPTATVRNPYIIDRPLTDQDLFFGRDRELVQLGHLLLDGKRLVLVFGGPRSGKTSFANQLPTRLGDRYRVQRVDLSVPDPETGQVLNWTLPTSMGELLWQIAVALARAVDQPVLGRVDFLRHPEAAMTEVLRAIPQEPDGLCRVVCIDALPAAVLLSQPAARAGIELLERLLVSDGRLVLVLMVNGSPPLPEGGGLGPPQENEIALSPLRDEEAEDLVMVPVRGTIAYSYEAVYHVQRLAGGHPYFLQLFGYVLFEERATYGWVGRPEVDQVLDQVQGAGAAHFQMLWEGCGPAAKLVLCAIAEMRGKHGVPSARDIGTFFTQMRVLIPPEHVGDALRELESQGVLERLGGETYRIRIDLFRRWLIENKTLQTTVREVRRYRRARIRARPAPRHKPVDWVGILLWVVAVGLAVMIAYVWRSREAGSIWTAGAPTPTVGEGGTPTIDAVAAGPATPQGHILYAARETRDDPWEVWVMGADGADPGRLTEGPHNDILPTWSPDGGRIAFVSDRDGNREIYVMNADGSDSRNLTNHAADDWTPCWSPDGRQIAFASFREGNWEIHVMRADGSSVRRLTEDPAADYSPSWSPDGSSIAFVSNRDGNLEIYVMRADGSELVRFTNEAATDQSPVWSPDGAFLAWESYRDGNMEIYMARPDGSELRNVSQDVYADDHGVTWSPTGRFVAFYSNRDKGWDIYTVDLVTGERLNITESAALEQAPHWGR
jgi:hypothetical protein